MRGAARPCGDVDRKNGQQAVADEFQYLASVSMDRVRLDIEKRVQYRDHLLPRQAVRARGEATKIRRPEDGGQLFACATANLTAQHLGTGAGSQVDIEQATGQRPLGVGVA